MKKFTASLIESKIEIYSGIKNILNSYQNRFDVGKNRDSNFVFGPSIPRTVYFGVRIQSK
jgi:outer membrane receptor for ferrienterochelin and colicins